MSIAGRSSSVSVISNTSSLELSFPLPQMPGASFQIRRAHSADEPGVYHVCLKTGNAGKDATELYTDLKALGHIFVGPYLHLEPDLAFVLVDDLGICGYVLGALDSARFYAAYEQRWLPPLRESHPNPSGDPLEWTPTEKVYHLYHRPIIYFPERFRDFPSHLHIDLLPRAQGQGNGRAMMTVMLNRLKDLGSRGVHLVMAATNTRAEKFYTKLGFHELERVGDGTEQLLYLGRTL